MKPTIRDVSPRSSATSGLRYDAGQQPAPQRHLPRQRRRRPAWSSRYTTQPPLGSPNPRDLWKWMAAYEEKTGGEVLAIAHNGNLSNGTMFPIIESFTGKKIDREYAEDRVQVGAALRSHADEGRRRDASVPLAQRRVRQLRDVGTRATST